MTLSFNRDLFVCAGLLCLASAPASAQNALPGENRATSPAAPSVTAVIAPSVTEHLQMQAGQIAGLNRLYDDYAARRMKHEINLAQWHNQLRHSPAYYEHGKAARLERSIHEAQRKVMADFLSTREKALKILTPVQRAQLESLANDTRIKVRGDRYYQMLLMRAEELWQAPLDNGFAPAMYPGQMHNERQARDYGHGNHGYGNYGVYGGYSYGHPQYGVYGSYSQGSVGVHAGVGRGGPSFGVSIGRVFGGWIYR